MVFLSAVADQYGMEAVESAVEDAIVRSVTVETCGEVLCRSGEGQLPRAVSAEFGDAAFQSGASERRLSGAE